MLPFVLAIPQSLSTWKRKARSTARNSQEINEAC